MISFCNIGRYYFASQFVYRRQEQQMSRYKETTKVISFNMKPCITDKYMFYFYMHTYIRKHMHSKRPFDNSLWNIGLVMVTMCVHFKRRFTFVYRPVITQYSQSYTVPSSQRPNAILVWMSCLNCPEIDVVCYVTPHGNNSCSIDGSTLQIYS